MKKIKTICFILPGLSDNPCGGYKVAYEYANRFFRAGYKVFVAHAEIIKQNGEIPAVPLKFAVKYYIKKFIRFNQKLTWFSLDKGIRNIRVPCIDDRFLPGADYYVATAVDTSYYLTKITRVENNKKFYLIQGFENWKVTDDYVYKSYKFPLRKIAIADWLLQEVEKTGQTAQLIYNGFDFDYFKMTVDIKNRKPATVAMLYHQAELKRCDDSLAALKLVKKQVPELTVTMFGTPDTPSDLPDWILYYQRPDKETHNKIYNSAAIFVAASKTEGMALPPAEAMICGCALACTDIGGFSVYAKDNETALLSPVCDPEKLAANILKLINDDTLRYNLAETGNKYIRQFTWENAFYAFKNEIEKN